MEVLNPTCMVSKKRAILDCDQFVWLAKQSTFVHGFYFVRLFFVNVLYVSQVLTRKLVHLIGMLG